PVEAKFLVVGEKADVCQIVWRQESVEWVAIARHRQNQPGVIAVESRYVPAVGGVVVNHVGVTTGNGPEELCEGLIKHDGPFGLVENADLKVDRFDDKVVANGRVAIGGQATA